MTNIIDNKFYLEGKIELQEETSDLKAKAFKVIELPTGKNRQVDLQYLSAILVSSGENLNHAYFMPSELVAAENTIINKALDVEHEEEAIIGHMVSRAFIDKKGNPLSIDELASKESASLDAQDMHIAVSAVVYKSRFPDIAKEIADKEWASVSMECYYQDYDIKIGELVLSKQEAEALGLASSSNSILGKAARVVKDGKEIAAGKVARVLRGICFSGCGIVKHPANPSSDILEVANSNVNNLVNNSDDVITLDYSSLKNTSNKVTSTTVDKADKEISRDGNMDDTTGICINYKRFIFDKEGNEEASDWCSAYTSKCTSFSRDTTDVNCLRNVDVRNMAAAFVNKALLKREAEDRRKELLNGLEAALREAVKTQSR